MSSSKISVQNYRRLFIYSLGIIIVVIGFSEALVMVGLNALENSGIKFHPLHEAALDSVLLSLISAPLLWFFSLRPLALKVKAQEQLKLDSELRTALDAHASVAIADASGKIIYVNDKFCEISGYSYSELIGQDQCLMVTDQQDQAMIKNLRHTLSPGQHWQGVFCNRKKNDEDCWVDTTIVPLWDDMGKAKQFISIFVDITAKRTNEAKLNALKRALDASNEMILITDAAGSIQYANPAVHRITGWSTEMLIDQPIDLLNSPNVDQLVLAEMISRLNQREAWSGRLLNSKKNCSASDTDKDGCRVEPLDFWVEINVTPIDNLDGSLFGYVQVQRNISQQVLEEATLQLEFESNVARLQIAKILQQPQPVKDSFVAILAILLKLKTVDQIHKGAVLLRSSSNDFLEMFIWQGDFSQDFLHRKHIFPIILLECGLVDKRNQSHNSLLDLDSDKLDQLACYTAPIVSSGEVLGLMLLYGTPAKEKNGLLISLLSQVSEMMALALLQEQAKIALESARDSALQAAKTKTEFLTNMSHEIRTPMNGVLGMLDLLKDTEMSKEQKDFIETAANSAEALLTIINDILDFSKLGAGKVELELVEFNLHTLVEEVCSLLAGRAHAKGIDLNCMLPANLPLRWHGDPTRIRQILTNLVGNGVKFTEQGEVSVSVAFLNELDHLGLRFEIKDTGIGIASEVQKRLFQPFSQCDNSTARRFGGSGLGLSICKDLLALMNGEIGVESKLNAGSIFWFTIPISPADLNSLPPLTDLTGKRALIVDDNETNRKILNHYLNYWGCVVGEADNALTALAVLLSAVQQNQPYDFLLSDLHMPDIDGFGLLRAVNENPAIANIPRLILSSGGLGFEQERQGLGIAQMLQKPVRQAQLFDAIVSALKLSNSVTKERSAPNNQLPNYQGRKVLVAEDNKVNQKVILALLAKFNITADLADNGEIALAKLANRHYDLILMDCQMPVMDGYQATRDWRSIEQKNHAQNRVPVVAVTAHAAEGERDKCLAAGMDDYLCKPISRPALMEVLQRWLGTPQKVAPIASQAANVSKQHTIDKHWDELAALNQLEGDEELLAEMIDLFLNDVPVRLANLKSALEQRDLSGLADVAHTLKGIAGHFFADQVKNLAVNLEHHARHDAQADFQLLAEDLRLSTVNLLYSLEQRKGLMHAR